MIDTEPHAGPRKLTVALVQTDPGPDKAATVARAFEFVERAARAGAQLVTLPETFHYRGPNDGRRASAEPIPGPLSESLSGLAAKLGIHLLAGSYNELPGAGEEDQRTHNTSLLFGPDGALLGKYRKIHLFDVTIGEKLVARESARNQPGDRAVVAQTAFGAVGMTVCYDLRFPELYRALALAGARLLTVPSNFAERTGRDHWEVLLRARAIENGAFVIAPATIGSGGTDFNAYGRSMIVDPWGTVVACAPDAEGITLATLDLSRVDAVRASLPSLQHLRPTAYAVKQF
jgi:predicted amidohydrolase